ncbi:MAG: nodulation protein NodH [Pseudomonadota bacterium]
MSQRFDYFVLFAEMRTGSNLLEENLNLYPELACLGEVFNPHFLAYPNTDTLLGFSQSDREHDPHGLLDAIRGEPGINGFRYFHDHQGAILDSVLDDPRCAKVVLTRNPLDSYVSWKIARATGQWKLTNATHHKAQKARFDPVEFEGQLAALQAFQLRILGALQRTAQTAFYLAYEDIKDVDVLNGLARFLGSRTELDSLSKKLKKQNPAPLTDKVENVAEMEQALSQLDRFDLTRTPNFEPRRGPSVPTYVGAARAPLLYLPMRSGPEAEVKDWLAAVDDVARDALIEDFKQKSLRAWKRDHPGHRSFTVLRHPVARAYRAFCDRIVGTGKGSYLEIRKTLMRVFNMPLAPDGPGDDWGADAQRTAFLAWLEFLKMNLDGQTAVRIDAAWGSQATALQGFSEFAPVDMVIREDRLEADLAYLAQSVGLKAPQVSDAGPADAIPLADIYDAEIEKAAQAAYSRDYEMFGFSDWSPEKN